MKFIVSSSLLLKRVSSINGIITANPIVPILDNYLFEVKENILTITSSDLQTYLSTSIEVESHGNFCIAIPAKILIETLKNLPDQPITFSIDEQTYNVEITSDNGRYKLACENSEDFPDSPESEINLDINLETSIFKKAINKLLFASSVDDLKPSMNGIFMKVSNDNTTFVATDGHKLAKYTYKKDFRIDNPYSCIIARKPLGILNSLSFEKENLTLSFSTSHVFINLGTLEVITRLIDEEFPDYTNVLPESSPYILTIDKDDLLSSLKRVAIYANKADKQVILKITGSELQIFTADASFSNEAMERLTCNYEGNDLKISFNSKFFIEALSNIDTEEVEIHMGEPHRSALMFPKTQKENEELLLLVMPIALKESNLAFISEEI